MMAGSTELERSYLQRRLAQEQRLMEGSSYVVRRRHEQLAANYEKRLNSALAG